MKKGGLRAYIIWMTGSLFYLYEYYVRVVPSVIETELEANFLATATEVAAAVGMYLMAYSPMQLVVGPLFDTCGSRKLFLPASLILTFSCLLPLLPTESLFCFGLGRFLMGFSSAFGFASNQCLLKRAKYRLPRHISCTVPVMKPFVMQRV